MATQLINPHVCMFIQSRAEVNFAVVDEYAALMAAETVFDPVQGCIDQDGQIYIWDGYHRGEAAKQSGLFLDAALRPGTKADAEWHALAANIKHGLRRTAADIERVVKAALKRHPDFADRELGRHCGVDHKTVAKYRKALDASGEIPQMQTRTVERNGTAYQMQTARQVEMPMLEPKTDSVFGDCDDVDDAQQAEQRYRERLRQCQAVVGRCFNTRDGIVKVLEVNTTLARIRTLRYGKNGEFYSMTENREVAELLHEVNHDDFHATMPAPSAPQNEPPYLSEHRTHWKCTACQKTILSGWGRFYPDGRMLCAFCMDAPTPAPAESHEDEDHALHHEPDDAPAECEPEHIPEEPQAVKRHREVFSVCVNILQTSLSGSFISISRDYGGTLKTRCYFLDKISLHSIRRVRCIQDKLIIHHLNQQDWKR